MWVWRWPLVAGEPAENLFERADRRDPTKPQARDHTTPWPGQDIRHYLLERGFRSARILSAMRRSPSVSAGNGFRHRWSVPGNAERRRATSSLLRSPDFCGPSSSAEANCKVLPSSVAAGKHTTAGVQDQGKRASWKVRPSDVEARRKSGRTGCIHRHRPLSASITLQGDIILSFSSTARTAILQNTKG